MLAFPLVSTLLRGDIATTVARVGALGSADPHTGDFTPAIHVDSFAIARQIARQSDALFPGTLSMLAPDVEAGRLVRLAFAIPVMRTSYSLMHLRDRTVSPAAQAFMDLLLAIEAELMAREAEDGALARRRREVRRRRPSARKTGTQAGRRAATATASARAPGGRVPSSRVDPRSASLSSGRLTPRATHLRRGRPGPRRAERDRSCSRRRGSRRVAVLAQEARGVVGALADAAVDGQRPIARQLADGARAAATAAG